VDDILDFTGSTNVLGKPSGSDLASGNLTAPVLYALEEKPKLASLIERQFSEADDLATAVSLVKQSKGIERSQALALEYVATAAASLAKLQPSPSTQALYQLTEYVVSRSS
jgi:all-trans-nonaprenyl-diphosphate synthase